MKGIDLNQKVNSYLCIALICVMTFWVVLYYFTHRAFEIADAFTQNNLTALDQPMHQATTTLVKTSKK